MRKILLFIFLCGVLTTYADERGQGRLESISRHYASLGSYTMTFTLSASGAQQSGEMVVVGEDSYIKLAETELYVVGSVRYEVNRATKEILIDRADLYEKELLNPTSGFTKFATAYNIEECEVDGAVAVRLTPKKSGETIYIITAADGVSISKVQYVSGADKIEMVVKQCKKSTRSLPTFSKERYPGFEIMDFR